MATKPQKQVLPSKEASLFKQVVKFYEGRQYKKGIKTADQILKKFPNHGETLSMKGLILNCMERKEEAYDFVKRGVKEDLSSHVSWHVFGLLYKSDREYNEAIKCYRNALRHDKENLQILRDLSWLQVHLRDLEGFMETRRNLLTIKPQQKAHWTAFALGAHLAKDYAKAIQILDEYEKTMEIPEKPDFETSEFILYKEMVIEESGDYQASLDYLNKNEKHIVDKLHLKERRGDLLFKLGRTADSEKQFRELIQINPEQNEYYIGLQRALGLSGPSFTPDQLEKLTLIYDELSSQYPKSDSCKRIPLQFLLGNAFENKLSEYLKNGIRKGIPSLFMSLKFIYNDNSKVKILENLVKSFVSSLESSKKFPNGNGVEAPDAVLWTKLFLAQHYDVIGDCGNAFKLIDEAIQHTPTVIELYVIKAKIYKHAGDLDLCSQYLEKARQMDLADRYLNNRSSKYLLRTNQVQKAISTLGLFTKEGDDVEKYLTDMQCMWFEQECGEAHSRLLAFGKALKKFTSIDRHFADITEDQFDFHTYCLRKMTLRSYVKMLRLEDGIYSYKYYVNAAKSILKTYLHVYDHPAVKETKDNDSQLENMSEEDRKKLLKKQKREQLKKEEEAKQQKTAQQPTSDKKKTAAVVDPDPEGNKLLEGDLLEKSTKFLQTLYKSVPKDVEALVLSVNVYLRKRKYLLALRSLKKSVALENSEKVHLAVVQFFKTVENEADKLNPLVKELVQQERTAILGNKSIEEYQNAFAASSKTAGQKLAAAEAMVFLHPEKKSEAAQLALQVETSSGYQNLLQCEKLYSFVCKLDENVAKSLKTKLHQAYPYATAFMSEEEVKARNDAILVVEQPTDEKN